MSVQVERVMPFCPHLARRTLLRRLPVVDDEGRIQAVFTQGDFVSYTWPDLLYQMKSIAAATVIKNWPLYLIGGGIALYSILMVVVIGLMN